MINPDYTPISESERGQLQQMLASAGWAVLGRCLKSELARQQVEMSNARLAELTLVKNARAVGEVMAHELQAARIKCCLEVMAEFVEQPNKCITVKLTVD